VERLNIIFVAFLSPRKLPQQMIDKLFFLITDFFLATPTITDLLIFETDEHFATDITDETLDCMNEILRDGSKQ
jgi:hypothetical protein